MLEELALLSGFSSLIASAAAYFLTWNARKRVEKTQSYLKEIPLDKRRLALSISDAVAKKLDYNDRSGLDFAVGLASQSDMFPRTPSKFLLRGAPRYYWLDDAPSSMRVGLLIYEAALLATELSSRGINEKDDLLERLKTSVEKPRNISASIRENILSNVVFEICKIKDSSA